MNNNQYEYKDKSKNECDISKGIYIYINKTGHCCYYIFNQANGWFTKHNLSRPSNPALDIYGYL